MHIPAGSLVYTCCQVPILLQGSDDPRIEVHRADGGVESISGAVLDAANSRHIFQRDGLIHHLSVTITPPKIEIEKP